MDFHQTSATTSAANQQAGNGGNAGGDVSPVESHSLPTFIATIQEASEILKIKASLTEDFGHAPYHHS
jgi:hypothetical protein